MVQGGMCGRDTPLNWANYDFWVMVQGGGNAYLAFGSGLRGGPVYV
jgi:hypothetical protein